MRGSGIRLFQIQIRLFQVLIRLFQILMRLFQILIRPFRVLIRLFQILIQKEGAAESYQRRRDHKCIHVVGGVVVATGAFSAFTTGLNPPCP